MQTDILMEAFSQLNAHEAVLTVTLWHCLKELRYLHRQQTAEKERILCALKYRFPALRPPWVNANTHEPSNGNKSPKV